MIPSRASLLRLDVLTTGQCARLAGVCTAVVTRWIDSGQLPGYRHPGSGRHRRVRPADLARFLELHGVPLEGCR
jgi:excisionase family DNA binding protein